MELSVIILSYNVRPYVWQCIDSVLVAIQGLEAEVILADNASQDKTIEQIAADFPKVKLLPNEENLGFAKAYNQAVKLAQGKYLCILNPDTVVGEGVFKSILNHLKGKDHIGAVGVQFIDGRGCFLPECKRVIPSPLGSLKKLVGLGGQKGAYYHDAILPDEQGPVSILAGAFLVLTKSDYLSIDGFDEQYFMFGEDIDFCYKLLQKAKENYYLGQQKIIHYKGESTQKNRQYLERFYGAMVHFYKTHYSQSKIKVLAVSMLAQLLILWRMLWPKRSDNISPRQSVEAVVWVSEAHTPNELMAHWLRKKASVTRHSVYRVQTPEEVMKNVPINALLIFDRATLSYEQIIQLMIFGAQYNQSFRIWHHEKSLLIGSDSSDAHGEALTLSFE